MMAATEIEHGTTLGKYEILRKIATGGMAEIYLARVRGTAGFEKMVVLKRILPGVADDPKFVQMFLDEARLAATLQHPNIADVYDVGEVAGQYFFTMEFVHGDDARSIRIASHHRQTAIPLSIGLAIAHGTASALDYAHEKTGPDGRPLGIVHRDVSSSNILVSFDGAVKLVDFGIARATASQHKTQTGTLKGKIPYMSPEQCRGGNLDRRSDLFSLGVVLYELTTNRRPFRGGSDFEIMEQIVHGGAAPPTSFMSGYPMDLEAIVMKLLARDPMARFQSADELIHSLESMMSARGLFGSAKQVSKFMRELFKDKLAAWEQAEVNGVSLGQFVAQTITSESKRSELITPVSSFPAVMPDDEEMLGSIPPPVVAPVIVAPVVEQAYPDLRPSRTRSWMLIAGVAIAAVVLGIVLWPDSTAPETAPASTVTAPTANAPSQTAPPPTEATPTANVPTPAATTPTANVPTPTVDPSTPPTPTAKPSTPTPSTAKPTRPTPVRQDKPTTKPVKPTKPAKPKEPAWDPNSPFLPPG